MGGNALNENSMVVGEGIMSMLGKLMDSKHGPLYATLFAILAALGIYEYAEKTGVAMEHGYDVIIKDGKWPEVHFARNGDDSAGDNSSEEESDVAVEE